MRSGADLGVGGDLEDVADDEMVRQMRRRAYRMYSTESFDREHPYRSDTKLEQSHRVGKGVESMGTTMSARGK